MRGSREIFGTVIEDDVYLLIDTSLSMQLHMPFVKEKIQLLMQVCGLRQVCGLMQVCGRHCLPTIPHLNSTATAGERSQGNWQSFPYNLGDVALRQAMKSHVGRHEELAAQEIVQPRSVWLLAVVNCQEQLRHKRSFNLIAFDSLVHSWQTAVVQVSEENLQNAWNWVNSLTCHGTTNTLAALQTAFKDKQTKAIYLLTDGRPDQVCIILLTCCPCWHIFYDIFSFSFVYGIEAMSSRSKVVCCYFSSCQSLS